MQSQSTLKQLLQVQRKLNEKKTAGEQNDNAALEAEKHKLRQRLNEENVAVFNETIFKPLGLYPFRPSAPSARPSILR